MVAHHAVRPENSRRRRPAWSNIAPHGPLLRRRASSSSCSGAFRPSCLDRLVDARCSESLCSCGASVTRARCRRTRLNGAPLRNRKTHVLMLGGAAPSVGRCCLVCSSVALQIMMNVCRQCAVQCVACSVSLCVVCVFETVAVCVCVCVGGCLFGVFLACVREGGVCSASGFAGVLRKGRLCAPPRAVLQPCAGSGVCAGSPRSVPGPWSASRHRNHRGHARPNELGPRA